MNFNGLLLVPKPDSDQIWKEIWENLNGVKKGLSNWKSDEWHSQAGQFISKVYAWLNASKKSDGVTIWNSHVGKIVEDDFGMRTEPLKVKINNAEKSIFLPSYASNRAPTYTEEKLWTELPELGNVDIYSIGTYFCPLSATNRKFIWQEHLHKLRTSGKIQNYWISEDGHLSVYVDSTIIKVLDLVPLVQSKVFTKLSRKFQGVENSARLADSPIRWEFYDLLELDVPSPTTMVGDAIRWQVRVKGIAELITVVTKLDSDVTTAEWLVWPNFKTENQSWKAYYCYSNSDNSNIVTLALSRKIEGFDRTTITNSGAAPVKFNSSSNSHVGGPPFGFCPTLNNEQFGLFLFDLPIKHKAGKVEIAVDFGTSNSAVAWRVDGTQQGQAIEFLNNVQELTLVVLGSIADGKRNEIAADGSWFPSFAYLPDATTPTKTLYSELIAAKGTGHKTNPKEYSVPLQHFSIPTSKCIKAENTVTRDFKWIGNTNNGTLFQGQYLNLLVEMALANIVVTHGIPDASTVKMLYPIRALDKLSNYKAVVSDVFSRISKSTGIKLEASYLDESRAAFTDPGTDSRLQLVADLGGGTLDLYVAGSSGLNGAPIPIADSVLLGGNELTKQISNYLPTAWSESKDSNLRRWLRESNMYSLLLNGNNKTIEGGITGFGPQHDTNLCKTLCDNYFELLFEYVSRNLVAYLSELRREGLIVSVKLSGNGWRLFYARDSLISAFAEIFQKLKTRITILCSELKIAQPTFEHAKLSEENLKLGPVIEALNIKEVIPVASSIATFDLNNNISWLQRSPFDRSTRFCDVTPKLTLFKGARRTSEPVKASYVLLEKINRGIDNMPTNQSEINNVSASIWEPLLDEIIP